MTPDRDSPDELFRKNWDRAFSGSSDKVSGEVIDTPRSAEKSDQRQQETTGFGTDKSNHTPQKNKAPTNSGEQPQKRRDWMTIATVILAFTSVVGLGLTYYNSSLTREAIDSSNDSSRQILRQMRNQNRGGLIGALAARNGAAAAASGAEAAIVSADAAKREAGTAAKALEVAQRAWITADISIDYPVRVTAGDVFVSTAVYLKNVGNSVATSAVVSFDVIDIDRESVESVQEKMCQDSSINTDRDVASSRGKKWVGGGTDAATIFPNGRTPAFSINKTLLKREPNPRKSIAVSPVIVGCATYRFESSSKNHQTGFAYEVFANWPEHPGMVRGFRSDETSVIPADQIRLSRWIGAGAFFAN